MKPQILIDDGEFTLKNPSTGRKIRSAENVYRLNQRQLGEKTSEKIDEDLCAALIKIIMALNLIS